LVPSSPPSITAGPRASAPPDVDTFRSKAQLLLRALLVMAAVLLFVGGAYINSLVANGVPVDFATFAGVAVPLVTLLGILGAAAFLWLWFFRVRRSNGATVLFVLANMAALALVTLGGALATQGYRRHIDAGLPARPKRSPVPEEAAPAGPAAVAPAHLAALGYLPPKMDLVAGVHIAEMLGDPAGAKLIEEPLRFGNAEVRLGDLPRKVGLEAGELDHFVAALRLDEPLSLVFVVRTRRPYDALKVRQALNARGLPGGTGDRTLYQVSPPGTNLAALLWCADEHTLLVGLSRESLENACLPGKQTAGSLDPDVRAVLRERVGPRAPLWAAGHAADWNKSAAGLFLSRLPDEWQQRLAAVRSFGVWATPDEQRVTLNAAARCSNETDASRLEKWLAGRGDAKKPPTLVRDGDWVSLQMRTDVDAFRGLLAP
jgi:hypothetical protein